MWRPAPSRARSATVGRLEVEPGGSNVIPGRVTGTLDVRAPDPTRRNAVVAAIEAACPGVTLTELAADPGVAFDPQICAALHEAAPDAIDLASYAGHDAGVLAAAGVPAESCSASPTAVLRTIRASTRTRRTASPGSRRSSGTAGESSRRFPKRGVSTAAETVDSFLREGSGNFGSSAWGEPSAKSGPSGPDDSGDRRRKALPQFRPRPGGLGCRAVATRGHGPDSSAIPSQGSALHPRRDPRRPQRAGRRDRGRGAGRGVRGADHYQALPFSVIGQRATSG